MKKMLMIVSICSLFLLLSTLAVTSSYATQITSSTYAMSHDIVDQDSVTNSGDASSSSMVHYTPPTPSGELPPGTVIGEENSSAAVYGTVSGDLAVSSEHMLHVGTVDFPGPTDGTAKAEVRWEQSYFMPSGSATSWNFSISSGALSIDFLGEGSGYSEAGYAINITVNGTLAWSSRATLSGNYANESLLNWVFDDTYDMLAHGCFEQGESSLQQDYDGPQNFSINLSPYSASGYVDVVYSMSVWATDMPSGSHIAGNGSEFINISYAKFGDPNDINTGGGVFIDDSGLTRVESTPDPVPEPATFLLLGSGLAGLVFYRRKR